jgi:F0F1-type ATP synthase membrane subunit b/b'
MDRMAGRREDMAAQKINQAKLDAIKSLRAEAAHIAVEAARRVMREQLAGKKGSTAMAQSIKSLES